MGITLLFEAVQSGGGFLTYFAFILISFFLFYLFYLPLCLLHQ